MSQDVYLNVLANKIYVDLSSRAIASKKNLIPPVESKLIVIKEKLVPLVKKT